MKAIKPYIATIICKRNTILVCERTRYGVKKQYRTLSIIGRRQMVGHDPRRAKNPRVVGIVNTDREVRRKKHQIRRAKI